MDILNADIGKLKKNSKDHKEIAEVMDMSASFIDGGPKIMEEPEFFKKYVRKYNQQQQQENSMLVAS